jgi:tetratricopeptide (TPR) repeat protein
MSIISTKRKATQAFTDPDKSIVTVKPFPKLPLDILGKISLFLDEKNFFNFARITSGLQERSISNQMWKNMKVKNGFDGSWALCAGEIKREKYEYCINKTICNVKSTQSLLGNNGRFNCKGEYNFKELLNELSRRFSLLKPYIEAGFANGDFRLYEEIEVAKLPFEAGEWMLKGFMLLAQSSVQGARFANKATDRETIADCFRQAIAQNATFVSKFAVQAFKETALQLEFAVQSALLGDERTLWNMVTSILSRHSTNKDLINKNDALSSFYSVLLYQAALNAEMSLETLKEHEKIEGTDTPVTFTSDISKQQAALELIEKALPLLRNQKVLIIEKDFSSVLLSIADFLSAKNRLAEAEEFYRFAMRASAQTLSPAALIRAAQNKRVLKKDLEAEELCERAMRASIPTDVLIKTALTKLSLGKEKEAEELYDYAIEKLGETYISPDVLANAALIKLKIKKHEEAEKFSDKVIRDYGKNVPVSVLNNAIIIKTALNKLQETNELIDYRIEKLDGTYISPNILADTAFLKLKLEKYQEAEKFSDQAIRAYGKNVPEGVLNNAIIIKKALNESQEAEELSKRIPKQNEYAIRNLDETSISPNVLADAAVLKLKIRKYQEAEKFSDQAIRAYGENVPMGVLTTAITIKKALNKFQEAAELSKRIPE